ncbi:MAG: tol-pal system YbgF family protein [bacterium]
MKNKLVLCGLVLIIATSFMLSCDSTKSDWDKAQELNTIEAYEEFIARHPESEYDSVATVKLEELHWQKISSGNELKTFEDFIRQFPQGKNISEATTKYEELVWGKAMKEGSLGSYEKYLIRFPNPTFSSRFKTKVSSEWFSKIRNCANELSQISEEARFEPFHYSLKTSFQPVEKKNPDGSTSLTFMPDPKRGTISVSGTVETKAGAFQKTAIAKNWKYVYSDSTRSSFNGWTVCVTTGELILPTSVLTNGPSNKYVDNFFEVAEFCRGWILIKLNPKENHRLCFEMNYDEAYGNLSPSLTINYPGTVILVGSRVFSCESDGWYFSLQGKDE